MRQPR